jgi:hypothetical protein
MPVSGDRPEVMAVRGVRLTLDDVRTLLEAEVLVDGNPDTPVGAIGAADLMSDVLALGTPGMLLLTGLAMPQAIRTAAVADLVGVVFVRNKPVADDVLLLARDAGMPVMRTRLTLFEASGRLYEYGMKARS